jgi:hypothetical protein
VLVELGPGAFPILKRLIDQGDVVDPDELVRIAQAIGRTKSPLGEPVLLAIVGANIRAPGLARANPDRYPARLDERAANAIDHLTGQKLGGSPARIRKWLATRPDAASP